MGRFLFQVFGGAIVLGVGGAVYVAANESSSGSFGGLFSASYPSSPSGVVRSMWTNKSASLSDYLSSELTAGLQRHNELVVSRDPSPERWTVVSNFAARMGRMPWATPSGDVGWDCEIHRESINGPRAQVSFSLKMRFNVSEDAWVKAWIKNAPQVQDAMQRSFRDSGIQIPVPKPGDLEKDAREVFAAIKRGCNTSYRGTTFLVLESGRWKVDDLCNREDVSDSLRSWFPW